MEQSSSTFRFVFIGALIAIFSIAFGALVLCFTGFNPARIVVSQKSIDASTEEQIRVFCGACHVVPDPSDFPRKSWRHIIAKSYAHHAKSGRNDLKAPDQEVITEYFLRKSPASLDVPLAPKSGDSPVSFRTEFVKLPDEFESPAVSYLGITPSEAAPDQPRVDLLVSDMGNGLLQRFSWNKHEQSSLRLGKLHHPNHIVPGDIDRDGQQDYLVADLGMLKPTNERDGSVSLLRFRGEGRPYEAITLLQGVARVSHAQIADLDGDGDSDIVIAETGYENVGRLLWLETLSINNGRPETKLHILDSRHGTIQAIVTDIDRDGDIDLIALLGREHQSIVAFLNDGKGTFEPQTLFQAETPSFGNTNIELIDLDGDGDSDFLFTNGDTLETAQAKPFHGVNWLENRGNLRFQFHRLATLPGAVRAVAGDLDGDGDLDIAAVAFCPLFLWNQIRPNTIDTLIWLEQTRPGEFERYSLEQSVIGTAGSVAGYMAIAAGDFDGDQDVDLAVGEYAPSLAKPAPGSLPRPGRWLTIHWNQSIKADEVNQDQNSSPPM